MLSPSPTLMHLLWAHISHVSSFIGGKGDALFMVSVPSPVIQIPTLHSVSATLRVDFPFSIIIPSVSPFLLDSCSSACVRMLKYLSSLKTLHRSIQLPLLTNSRNKVLLLVSITHSFIVSDLISVALKPCRLLGSS